MIIPLYPTAWQQKTAVSAVVIGGATRSAGGRTGSKRADDHEGGTARTECEVANTSNPVFVITDKTLKSIEKLVENLKKLHGVHSQQQLAEPDQLALHLDATTTPSFSP